TERRQKSELRPAHEELRGRITPEAAHVVAPVGEAAHGRGEAAAQGVGEIDERALRVARPGARLALNPRRRARPPRRPPARAGPGLRDHATTRSARARVAAKTSFWKSNGYGLCISVPVSPFAKTASAGISSAKSGLNESAPRSSWSVSLARYHAAAAGFVKST